MVSLVIVLFSNGFAVVDSVMPNGLIDIDFSAIETMTLSYSYEIELEEHSQNSILFSGGSFLYSDSFFDSQMWGLGVDAEFRRYKAEGYTGFFISGVTRASLKWTDGGDMIESINTGMKLGWKCNLTDTGVQIDLEPSFGVGLMVDNAEYIGWEFDPDAYIGLGLGLAIH
ncbi:MAG: hypothetical protein KAR40_15125 [Candidatus Sabulitectum sp.]|nr:hypothetical protein [Candidatus Sabulitectum sp.]